MHAPICPICLDDNFFPPAHKDFIYECLCDCHMKQFKKEMNDKGIPRNRG